jgi:TP901 family phage tail tape measure protein
VPATVRDILLTIRAKEEASRAINNIAGSMRRAQMEAAQASARARANALRAQAYQAQVRAEMLRQQLALARVTGATRAQVTALQNLIRQEQLHAANLRRGAADLDKQAAGMREADKKTGRFAQSLTSVGQAAQIAGLGLIAMGAAGVYGMSDAIQVAAAWDKQVRLTFTQVDKRYKPSLEELSDIGLRVARDIAIPFEQVQTALFDVFSSTEANMPEAEALLRSFSQAAVAGQTDVQTAARATIGLMNTYKIPFKDVNKILDIQFQLVQEGVGTYEEWAQRIGLVTPSAARAGQSIETMAAALATATRSGMSAARSGTAVARAFDAMSNPKTEEALSKIGVKTRDAQGNFRPLVEVLGDWRAQLEKMPKEDRVKAILDTLKGAGSTIEARRFLQNILLTNGGLELFQDQIKEFATDKGAFQRAYDDMANSVSAKTTTLRNSWMTLKQAIGEALLPAFTTIVDHVKMVVDWFNKLPDSTKSTIANFILWGSVLGIVGGAITLVIAGFVALAATVATAGAALLPVMGTMVAIGAVIAVVVAGVTALGVAFAMAYKNSAPFRAMIQSLWNLMTSLLGVLRTAGTALWTVFSQTLGPALKQVWATLETQLFPAITRFSNWVRANVVPALHMAAQAFATHLKPGLQDAANIIRANVIPAITSLTNWFKRNEATIKTVIMAVARATVVLAAIAGTILGLVIRAFARMAGTVRPAVQLIINIIQLLGSTARTHFNAIGGLIRALVGWWNAAGRAVGTAIGRMIVAVARIPGQIQGVFAGAQGWLINAGHNIVQGLINGIQAMVGQAAAAAANLGRAAVNAAQNALGIASPSKVFKDIGINVVRGFINGIDAERDTLISKMNSLGDAIAKSINAAKISKAAKKAMDAKWDKRLASVRKRLLDLESRRAGVQKRLEAAEEKYNALLEERKKLFEQVRDAMLQSADLTTLDDKQKKSATSVADALQGRLAAMQKFQTNLATLAKKGLDKTIIADLASKGVDAAGDLVNVLAQGSNQDIKRINDYEKQMREISNKVGNTVADSLYKQGINAAKGLVDGLKSQIGAITKEMTKIATALVKQIRKELGIKSPSTVMADIGRHTAQGYTNGYVKTMNRNLTGMAKASLFTPASARVGFGSGSSGLYNTGTSKTFNQNITVNTQEIDPRKQAAALGWELQGRL